MTHDEIKRLVDSHAALRLLRAVNAPLILGFLYVAFLQPNRRSIAAQELSAALDDYLDHLHHLHGPQCYPKSAREYLDDWANASAAFLRKYYPAQSEDAEFDLTVGAETALNWLHSLKPRPFAGTESRLLSLFELLRALVAGSETSVQARVRELEARKQQIEQELERARAGLIEPLDATHIKERYFELEDSTRRLLGDFRQVEENFRALDQRTRETLTVSQAAKGVLLDTVFGEQDYIRASDQGKSFAAFWDYLMSPERQDELARLLETALSLPAVQSLEHSGTVIALPQALLGAGERVRETASLLVAQLRRFLDDRAQLENRRILELAGQIERKALAVREYPPAGDFITLDALHPEFHLPLARPLFTPSAAVRIDDTAVPPGEADDLSLDALLAQHAVDEAELDEHIRDLLAEQPQVTLAQLAQRFPLRYGVAEIVGYLTLAGREGRADIDPNAHEVVPLPEREGQARRLRVPKVIFIR